MASVGEDQGDGQRMSKTPPLSESSIEQLARQLGECGTGSEITRVLKSCGLDDNSGESTKWKGNYILD